MRASITRLLLAAAVAAVAPVAFALPFSGAVTQSGAMTFDGAANGYAPVSIYLQGTHGNNYWGVSAGEFRGSFDPAGEDLTPGAEADDFLRFFCIDLYQFANTGPNAYTRTEGIAGTTEGAELSRLFDLYFPNPNAGQFYAAGQTGFGAFPSTAQSAAFQLAVWEITHDTDMNLGTGTFRAADGSVTTLAQQMLDAVGAGPGYVGGWRLYTFTNPSYQDYLSVQYSPPREQQLPLPGTLALFGIAAVAAGMLRRPVRA